MAVFTSDNFNAGTPGDNLTVDTAWENHAGNAVYSDAGRARITGTVSTLYSRKDVAPASTDYTARATIRALTLVTNGSAGVSVRAQSGANTAYIGRGQHTTNTWRLERRVAGVTTLLGSSAKTFSATTDYLVELTANGTALELFADGVSVVAQTDGNITAAGAPGINFFQSSGVGNTTGWHIDNFEGEEAGGGTGATAAGTTITATASVIAGGASGGVSATAAGTTVTATTSLTAGAASGVRNATAAGTTVTATASLTAGAATGAGGASALGALLTAAASLIAGAASGVRNATASGALLAAVASLLPGSANNGELPAFTSIFGLVTRRRRR